MRADDILRVFYARGMHTAAKKANQEAEKRLNVRPQTPHAFGGVFTTRATKEIREARDKPHINVHEHLDNWEVDTLAAVARSLKHHELRSRGPESEYMATYRKAQYGLLPSR
eukprot:CAMPEP_0198559668 /NCGR_PEP_ID=MMETSP1462-20131121/92765_1 /TAXON_ID=1333877 /ORGANISM="Brandtodinium nutriculum, Strain RCC3387" /LENGTH=111 /DNA_ID=CAMNT_0044290519 /DNA_START=1 /DNA_END=333 /DNA_ORIENTATION=+